MNFNWSVRETVRPLASRLFSSVYTPAHPYSFHIGASFAPKPPIRFAGEKPRVPFPSDGIIGSWRNKMLSRRKAVQTKACGEDFFFYVNVDAQHVGSYDIRVLSCLGGLRVVFGQGVCLGVADGITAWLESGVDPALFSQALMFHAHRYARSAWAGEPEVDPTLDYEEREQVEGWELTPYECMDLAYGGVLREKAVEAGSSTACILTLNSANGLLRAANLGDSGFSIIRGGSILYSQPVQTHFFNCPKQLTKLPPPSGKRFTRACVDSPRDAETYQTQLCNGDIIVAYTDGLTDNVFPHEMAEICSPDPEVDPSDDAQVQSMADRLIIHARDCMAAKTRVSPFERHAAREGMFFPGGKPDELSFSTLTDARLRFHSVTVVVALVRETEG
ncbi:phosphatase 2C-like domain-containing protein [Mycena metata]|uniref:Protein phosphatase n=1 Tax=Mycena metata TaxID=1033252 RepID=A0AAD7NEZ3_9AGAR|nr:phosphatase 2C-like domain-containing protein [Mycena metata]